MYACKSLVSCLVRFLLFVDGVTVRARRFSVVDACGWARIWVWARATALLAWLSLFCLHSGDSDIRYGPPSDALQRQMV